MSWEQLDTARDRNREAKRVYDQEPPVACPIDGAILEVNSLGVRNCPMGNFRWNGGSKDIEAS
jgi:hypothetical protein